MSVQPARAYATPYIVFPRPKMPMPRATRSAHPDATTLRLFVLGRLASDTMDQVERHIGECGGCAIVAAAIPGDRFVELLRRIPSFEVDSRSSISSNGEHAAEGPGHPSSKSRKIEGRE